MANNHKPVKGNLIYQSTQAEIYEGQWKGREDIAIKVLKDPTKAREEISFYQKYDSCRSILRLHDHYVENDGTLELILEKGSCTLTELIRYFFWRIVPKSQGSSYFRDKKIAFLKKVAKGGNPLWENGDKKPMQYGGNPTPKFFSIIRDVVKAVGYMHGKRVCYGKLDPSNVLIMEEADALQAKISMSRGCTKGWKAPELKEEPPLEEATEIDMFGLGLIIYFCASQGKHPFGDIESLDTCQQTIDKGRVISFRFMSYEAEHLITSLLKRKPSERLDISSVLSHPFFWKPEKRISFYTEVANKLKNSSVQYQNHPESMKVGVLDNFWYLYLDDDHRKELDSFLEKEKQNKMKGLSSVHYSFFSVTDLIRFIRNSIQHQDKYLLKKLDWMDGSTHSKLEAYFRKCFPRLFMSMYNFAVNEWRYDDDFRSFFSEEN